MLDEVNVWPSMVNANGCYSYLEIGFHLANDAPNSINTTLTHKINMEEFPFRNISSRQYQKIVDAQAAPQTLASATAEGSPPIRLSKFECCQALAKTSR